MTGAEKIGPSITSFDRYAVSEEKPVGVPGMMYLGDCLFYLKLSQATFYRRIADGKIPKPAQYNNKSVWYKNDLDHFLQTELKGAR